MQETLYAIHPLLPDLKVNEDGTEIIWRGKPLKITARKDKRYKSDLLRVSFKCKTHRVSRLVCECWHGMGKVGQVVRKHDVTASNHFNNLYWSDKGKLPKQQVYNFTKSQVKITEDKYQDICTRFKASEAITSIAKSYNVTAMTIYRIKNKMI